VSERLVVIGGDAAGMSAASQARRLKGPDALAITVFERGTTTSYAACGIPYWIAGMVDARESLIARTPEVFRDKQAIDVRIRHEAVAIDTDARTVTVRDLDAGSTFEQAYDQLLIATGARPIRPPIEGIDADGVFGIQTLDDGEAVIDELERHAPERAVIIGAGYIGVEMAEALCLRGLEVHVVDVVEQPMATLDPEIGERVADAMRDVGITLHLGVPAERLTLEDGRVRGVVVGDREIACDLVVLGTGARPRVELARDAGIPIGPSGGIVTDASQRTPVDGVWAAGDCAETFHRVSRRPVSIALGTIANKQGRIAGRNLAGSSGTFPGVLGTAITQMCGLEVARTGLNVEQAREAGFTPVVSTITSSTRAGYYPDTRPITVKLVVERATGRLLGGQIVGEEGAAKRIDALALALWNEMTVDALVDVDLAYAPPFSPVWDPVLIAARQATSAVVDDLCGDDD
jgi:NADPH-dependent 2,4-dienoyl-CoA reductase/sulfur reductase-like enzyme